MGVSKNAAVRLNHCQMGCSGLVGDLQWYAARNCLLWLQMESILWREMITVSPTLQGNLAIFLFLHSFSLPLLFSLPISLFLSLQFNLSDAHKQTFTQKGAGSRSFLQHTSSCLPVELFLAFPSVAYLSLPSFLFLHRGGGRPTSQWKRSTRYSGEVGDQSRPVAILQLSSGPPSQVVPFLP